MIQNAPDPPVLTVFYNGSCPLCRTEINHYKKRADKYHVEGLLWVDVTQQPNSLASFGVDDDGVIRRLHASDGDGSLFSGVDAFIAVWQLIPGYQWIAALASFPIIRTIADLLYNRLLAPGIYRWNKAKGRVPPSA